MPRPNVSATRRPQILAAAAGVFLRDGLSRARMEDIARQAGLSVGSLYWYYPNKEDLVLHLVEAMIEPDLQSLRRLLDAPGSLRLRMSVYLDENTAGASSQLPLLYEIYSHASRHDEVRRMIRGYLDSYRLLLETLIRAAIAAGEIAAVDPAGTAMLLAALYEGMIELAMIDPQGIDLRAALLDGFDRLLPAARENP